MSRIDDTCCHGCKTPFAGVCRERHACWCHLQNRADTVKTGRYAIPDPTGNKAVHNATVHPHRSSRT